MAFTCDAATAKKAQACGFSTDWLNRLGGQYGAKVVALVLKFFEGLLAAQATGPSVKVCCPEKHLECLDRCIELQLQSVAELLKHRSCCECEDKPEPAEAKK